jgi:hypothetical protein
LDQSAFLVAILSGLSSLTPISILTRFLRHLTHGTLRSLFGFCRVMESLLPNLPSNRIAFELNLALFGVALHWNLFRFPHGQRFSNQAHLLVALHSEPSHLNQIRDSNELNLRHFGNVGASNRFVFHDR